MFLTVEAAVIDILGITRGRGAGHCHWYPGEIGAALTDDGHSSAPITGRGRHGDFPLDVPGNEQAVARLIEGLEDRGVDVLPPINLKRRCVPPATPV